MTIFAKWLGDEGRFAFSLTDNGGQRISEGARDALLLSESVGKLLVPDENGFPIAVDAPGPTDEQLADEERSWRDRTFLTASGIRDRHRDELELGIPTTLLPEQFKELLAYMQALREWPQSSDFPLFECRPAAPVWLEWLT
ncbi:tail fiber assembly protein [Pseudomonas protegens]|uniref:phage tail protein n=1 Tax=Pseudomonas protegens TaxID=380021 RepID=UPI00384EE6C2